MEETQVSVPPGQALSDTEIRDRMEEGEAKVRPLQDDAAAGEFDRGTKATSSHTVNFEGKELQDEEGNIIITIDEASDKALPAPESGTSVEVDDKALLALEGGGSDQVHDKSPPALNSGKGLKAIVIDVASTLSSSEDEEEEEILSSFRGETIFQHVLHTFSLFVNSTNQQFVTNNARVRLLENNLIA